MTPRSIRRAAERKAKKAALKAQRLSAVSEFAVIATAPEEEEAVPVSEAPSPDPRPVSLAQLSANRANAQRSTGPTSAEGRAKASLNA